NLGLKLDKCYHENASATDFVTARQHGHGHDRHQAKENSGNNDTDDGICIPCAEKTVAKTVNHVEKRIEIRGLLPECRQRMNRVEHAGEKTHRHDEKVLERGQMIEL